MIDSSDFLSNHLFCEWAYIIDLSEEVLHVFGGPNTYPESKISFSFELVRTIPTEKLVKISFQRNQVLEGVT